MTVLVETTDAPFVAEQKVILTGPLRSIFTRHRLLTLTYLVLGMVALYNLQDLIWPKHAQVPQGAWNFAWSAGTVLWLGAVIPGAIGVAGMLRFKYNDWLDWVAPIDTLVSFRIVSRGTNVKALTDTVRRCQLEMARTPMFPYVIEVVTDTQQLDLPEPNDDIRYIVVPLDYVTPGGSLYKARALHYACENSALPGDAWIVHLDEETQPTRSGIQGIAKMIDEEERSGRLRIGQGALLYHRSWRQHPFLTLADNVRTGDDFARFYFQHKLGVTIFGLHGSYIVVRNDLEKSIGFDFGPQGSITEDAFWALKAMEAGKRARWVEGFLEEQSTQSVSDFVKQRRRWFQGLAKVAIHAPVKLRWRACIGTNTLLWTFAPFSMMYTVAHFFYGFDTQPVIRLLANFSFASFTTLYLIGLHANLKEHGITSKVEKTGWWLAQVALMPVFSALEGFGVLLAIVRPVSGFHVVNKD